MKKSDKTRFNKAYRALEKAFEAMEKVEECMHLDDLSIEEKICVAYGRADYALPVPCC